MSILDSPNGNDTHSASLHRLADRVLKPAHRPGGGLGDHRVGIGQVMRRRPRPGPASPLLPGRDQAVADHPVAADALDRRAGEHLAERRRRRAPAGRRAAARPAPRAAGTRGSPPPPRRSGSTGRPRGNRRSRRCGCRSPRGTRPGSARHARSSGRRCSAAHRSGARPDRLRRAGVEAARAGPAMHPGSAGASGSSSSSVRITPRNSQLPCSRETRLVCLPCQPIPAACGQRLFHHRRGVDEHLELARGPLDDEPRQRLQRLLDRLVIVAALRIDRDAPALALARQAPSDRSPARSSFPARSPTSPPATSAVGDTRWSARVSIQPIVPWCPASSQRRRSSPAASRRIGAREAAGDEAEPLGLGPYCFLKGLALIHGARHTPPAAAFS